MHNPVSSSAKSLIEIDALVDMLCQPTNMDAPSTNIHLGGFQQCWQQIGLPELSLYPLSVGPLHEDLSVRHVVHEVALNLVVLLRLERSASVGHAASEHPFKSEWGGGVNPLQFHCIK